MFWEHFWVPCENETIYVPADLDGDRVEQLRNINGSARWWKSTPCVFTVFFTV